MKSINRGGCSHFFLLLLVISSVFLGNAVAGEGNDKRIIVLVDEHFQHLQQTTRVTEHLLRSLFENQGFDVVDEAQVNEVKKRTEIYHFMQGDNEAALSVDLQHEADFVVRGKAIVQSGKEVLNSMLRPRLANVSFDIFATDTGKILFSGSSSGTYPHIDELQGGIEALRIAVEQSSDDLLIALMPEEKTSGSNEIEIILHGVSSFSDYSRIQSILSKQGFQIRAIQFAPKTGYYLVKNADPMHLAEQLSNVKTGSLAIEVVEMTAEKIRVEINPSNTELPP